MSSAKAIVEAATFVALDGAIEGASVWQDAPADAAGHLVIVGDLKSFRLASTKGGDADRRVSISIVSLVEAEERAPLLAIQDRIEQLLDGETIEHDGWTLAFTFEEDDAVLDEDGSTYTGVSNFTVLAIAP